MIIPILCVGTMACIFSFLAGYEKAQKEDQEFEAFWKEVEKRV